jgi:DNA-binding IclR family transcriptional regulator
MSRRQAGLRVRLMCWTCVLALIIVSGTGSATAAPRVAMSDLEKQAAAFLQRLGFALHGEVVCASVSIGTQAYVCQALGSPQNLDASLQQAQLLTFYCSSEGVCWFAPGRMP